LPICEYYTRKKGKSQAFFQLFFGKALWGAPPEATLAFFPALARESFHHPAGKRDTKGTKELRDGCSKEKRKLRSFHAKAQSRKGERGISFKFTFKFKFTGNESVKSVQSVDLSLSSLALTTDY
jgi:hypothetical protein